MKTLSMTFVAAAFVAGIGSASAQEMSNNTNRDAFQAAAPFADSGVVLSGRSAFVGRKDTDRVYGNGLDGQGVLAPHINGIF